MDGDEENEDLLLNESNEVDPVRESTLDDLKDNANDFSYIQKVLDSKNLEKLVDKFLEDGDSIGAPLFTSEEMDKILQEGTGPAPITKKRRIPG